MKIWIDGDLFTDGDPILSQLGLEVETVCYINELDTINKLVDIIGAFSMSRKRNDNDELTDVIELLHVHKW